jgi:glycosyltransferase involved in cell wall biosynthesis
MPVTEGLRVTATANLAADDCAELLRRGACTAVAPIDSDGQNPARDFACLIGLVRLLRATRPSLVHLFGIKPLIYGSIAAKLVGVPAVIASVTGRGSLALPEKRWLMRLVSPLIRLALADPTRAVFQNLEDRDWYLAEGLIAEARAIHIQGSGVDTDALRPALNLPPASRRSFVLAARMLWAKGIAEFVQAARLVKARYPDAEFLLFGGCKEVSKSKHPRFIDRAWLEALNQEGVVHWRGFRPPSVVEAAMREAAAVVLPSYYAEGVPRSLIEAAAAGVPIITTDMPGCRDTVQPKQSGYLVPPRSPEALAKAMCELLANPERIRRMGEAGRRIAEKIFDSRLINVKTLAVYQNALGRPLRGDSKSFEQTSYPYP